ncbi:spore coat-associated protein N [Arthrobacter sp. B3I9]|uniref:TasA family protein n=1 Tax=Arthrobacter sp. B3I9 TaxID=3042270 RepID=UPI0027947A53|nr:TasA family protein [Arthrobacter sp. B3I9]MDQ0851430.1 spore coat-associated protein N [Arthrobacter sp. B3I9]
MGLNLKSTSSKVLASAILLTAAAAVAGLGTYGDFTSTTVASATVNAGTVKLQAGDGQVTFSADGMIPGDSMQRTFKLSNDGNTDLASIILTSSAAASLLTTGENGLTMAIDSCPVEWTASPAGSNVFTCAAPVAVLKSQAATFSGVSLTPLASLKAKAGDNLRVTLTLPGQADDRYQGLRATIALKFDAVQRLATSK